MTWLVLAPALAGCGYKVDAPALPPLKSDHTFLTKDQQAQAMAAISAKKEAETAAALRQIEQGKK